jgi:hypothetical protein
MDGLPAALTIEAVINVNMSAKVNVFIVTPLEIISF